MQSSEYARRSRLSVINCQHMLVCVEWAWYHVKPGGTAGSFYPMDFYDPVPADTSGTGSLCIQL